VRLRSLLSRLPQLLFRTLASPALGLGARALGRCDGSRGLGGDDATSAPAVHDDDGRAARHHAASRYQPAWHDDAVARLAPYRFAIAAENAAEPGYVTEKLVNAFLARAVPIYVGPPDVAAGDGAGSGGGGPAALGFDPRAFVHCGAPPPLAGDDEDLADAAAAHAAADAFADACAARVASLHRNETAYREVLESQSKTNDRGERRDAARRRGSVESRARVGRVGGRRSVFIVVSRREQVRVAVWRQGLCCCAAAFTRVLVWHWRTGGART